MSDTIEKARIEAEKCIELMEARCSKYGESWRGARLSSLIDYSIMKYKRVNKMVEDIENNKEKIKSDLQDMINYALMALIKLEEEIQNI